MTNLERLVGEKPTFSSKMGVLTQNKLMSYVVSAVQEVVKSQNLDLSFLTKAGWEALAVLNVHHPKSLMHSLGVYKLLIKKLHTVTINGMSLADVIAMQVNPRTLFMAVVGHDLGKIDIPECVLSNSVTNGEWTRALLQMIRHKKCEHGTQCFSTMGNIYVESFDDLALLLEMKNIRASQVVPLAEVLPRRDVLKLELSGIDSRLTIRGVMNFHESRSGDNLRFIREYPAARIAEEHHNYTHCRVDMKGMLHLPTLVHCLDVPAAMLERRGYFDKPFSMAEVLAQIERDIQTAPLHPYTARVLM